MSKPRSRARYDVVAVAVFSGCVGIIGPGDDAGTGPGDGGHTGPSNLPCDVQGLLARRCQTCHVSTPPGPLATRADLAAPSRSDPTKSMAAVALERMELSTVSHMPPPPLESATLDELGAFRAWIEGGMPKAVCDRPIDAGPDPYDTPVVCSSGTSWTGGNRESPLMRPGGACIDCHTRENEGPTLAIAGTVYPTPHEPNDCNGVTTNTSAVVVISDALGSESRLQVNGAGNFFLETETFQYPYTARVEYGGKVRVMVEQQTSGDCNHCHTESGTENAPGRIFLP